MSQEKVELMRRLLEAWAAGDMATVETLSRDHLSPDFEWRPLYLDRVYRGIDGMRQVRAEVSEAWEGYRSEIEEIVDLGEHVLVLARISGRGAGSGVPVEQAIAVLCAFQGEQAVWAESFASRDQALEAAGLNGGNVDVVLRLHAAFNRADLEGILAEWHPEGVYHAAITQVVEGEEQGAFHGHDGFRRWWADMQELYSDLNSELLEVRDLGDQVLTVLLIRGRGRGSGIYIAEGFELTQLFTVHDGKITEARDYFSREDALAAANA